MELKCDFRDLFKNGPRQFYLITIMTVVLGRTGQLCMLTEERCQRRSRVKFSILEVEAFMIVVTPML